MNNEKMTIEILDLLDRDKARRVKEIDIRQLGCPVCGLTSTGNWLKHGMNFCPNCGQRLDWRDEE